jgi:glycosyltransferase involved in cell wall biosynthesis
LRAIVINRFFYPDHSATSQMLSDLAFGLAERGLKITVITSRLDYASNAPPRARSETIDGVDVRRIWTTRFGRSRLLLRAIDYLTFYCSAAWELFRTANRDDIVIAMTDPPMLSVIAAPIIKLRGARLVTWLQDLFPEIAEALNVGGKLTRLPFSLLRGIRNISLRSADMNVAIGELMAHQLSGPCVPHGRIRVVPNWADTDILAPISSEDNHFRRDWNLSDYFVIGYSGNLGRAHEMETLLEAIGALEARIQDPLSHSVRWLFIGGGHTFEIMKREVSRRGLKSVTFRPYQPREQLSQSLSAADVHIVTLKPELEGLIVPSKFYGVAAAGRPSIFIGAPEGEIARLIERHACGLTIAHSDSAALVEAVLGLSRDPELCRDMGRRARTACETLYSRRGGIEAWAALLQEIALAKARPISDTSAANAALGTKQ